MLAAAAAPRRRRPLRRRACPRVPRSRRRSSSRRSRQQRGQALSVILRRARPPGRRDPRGTLATAAPGTCHPASRNDAVPGRRFNEGRRAVVTTSTVSSLSWPFADCPSRLSVLSSTQYTVLEESTGRFVEDEGKAERDGKRGRDTESAHRVSARSLLFAVLRDARKIRGETGREDEYTV